MPPYGPTDEEIKGCAGCMLAILAMTAAALVSLGYLIRAIHH